MTPDKLAQAERLATLARNAATHLNSLSWRLDSALSMHRKALLGYRANPVLGDAPWNPLEYEEGVNRAAERVARLASVLETLARHAP